MEQTVRTSDTASQADAFRRRGNELYKKRNRHRAIEEYSKALLMNPLSWECWSNRSEAYLALDQPLLALDDALRLQEVAPDNAKALYRLGRAHAALGTQTDLSAAVRCFETLSAKFPHLREVDAELQRIRSPRPPLEAVGSLSVELPIATLHDRTSASRIDSRRKARTKKRRGGCPSGKGGMIEASVHPCAELSDPSDREHYDEAIARAAAFMRRVASTSDVSPCVRIVDVPGMGRGAVATRELHPGDTLFWERPLLAVNPLDGCCSWCFMPLVHSTVPVGDCRHHCDRCGWRLCRVCVDSLDHHESRTQRSDSSGPSLWGDPRQMHEALCPHAQMLDRFRRQSRARRNAMSSDLMVATIAILGSHLTDGVGLHTPLAFAELARMAVPTRLVGERESIVRSAEAFSEMLAKPEWRWLGLEWFLTARAIVTNNAFGHLSDVSSDQEDASSHREDASSDLVAMHTSLFVLTCTLNHSCVPNCAVRFGSQWAGNAAQVVALKPIAKGDQVCISYIDSSSMVSTAERRLRLLKNYGFVCKCTLCSAS